MSYKQEPPPTRIKKCSLCFTRALSWRLAFSSILTVSGIKLFMDLFRLRTNKLPNCKVNTIFPTTQTLSPFLHSKSIYSLPQEAPD